MTRTALGAHDVSRTGVVVTEAAADVANGNIFANDDTMRTFLLVRNAHATISYNVTLPTPGLVDGLAIADRVVAVAALTSKLIGPFPIGTYNVDGDVLVDGENTNLKFAVIRVSET